LNFIQPNFFIFLFTFCLLYHSFGQKARVSVGIVGSFYFYAYFSPAYSLLLLVSSIVDFWAGRAIGRLDARLETSAEAVLPEGEAPLKQETSSESETCFKQRASSGREISSGTGRFSERCVLQRRKWLVASLICNLGMLFSFKYLSFFWNAIAAPLEWTPMDATLPPMGISFFTFQTLSYTIDVYRGHLKPIASFKQFLFFISFFPQLVAGPIVRARDFLPQISNAKFDLGALRWASLRFLRGFLKKTCLADGLGVLMVDPVHADLAGATPVMVWMAVIAYGLQLYLDFSGYSDMAIALGRLLGFKFPENFNYPYLATSFSDFWKRWHISLSSWLRDYLYISCGGNRCSQFRGQVNLMITMVLGGLWHGAGWNFLIWGILNGGYLVVEHLSGFRPSDQTHGLKKLGGHVWVIGGYFFSLIFFRATSTQDVMLILEKCLSITWKDLMAWSSQLGAMSHWQLLLLLCLAGSGHALQAYPSLKTRFAQAPLEVKAITVGTLGFWLFHFYPTGQVSPFIYFQF
jgi:alginate O-acetyltransferase complex protein AlgI